jgi:hypothetical protein
VDAVTDWQFRAAPDDFDHPDHEQLVALVDHQLDDIDREWILSHVEDCAICKADLEDLRQVQASLVVRRPRVKREFAIVAAAAGVVLSIWMGYRNRAPQSDEPVATPVAQTQLPPVTPVPAASSSAPAPAATSTSAAPATSVLTEDERGRVARALASGRMEMPPNMDVLRGHAGTLLGSDASAPVFRPVTPLAMAVLETRPQFSWTPRAGARSYAVTIFDERFREIAKSGSVKTTTWKPRQDLPRGRVLQWQITATIDEGIAISPAPPNPEARFIILDNVTVANLARERKRLATEPVALGLELARAGLFAEAESVFQSALTDKRYDRSQVNALLARLRAR